MQVSRLAPSVTPAQSIVFAQCGIERNDDCVIPTACLPLTPRRAEEQQLHRNENTGVIHSAQGVQGSPTLQQQQPVPLAMNSPTF